MGNRSRRGGHRSLLGDEAHGSQHGAALGTGGIAGWWAWKERGRTQHGVDAVRPATLRGAVNVTLWLLGLTAVTVLGTALTNWPTWIWFTVALAVMIAAGTAHDRRARRRRET